MSAPDRRRKLDRAHPVLSIRRQCALLSLARLRGPGQWGSDRFPNASDKGRIARDQQFVGRFGYDVLAVFTRGILVSPIFRAAHISFKLRKLPNAYFPNTIIR